MKKRSLFSKTRVQLRRALTQANKIRSSKKEAIVSPRPASSEKSMALQK